MNRTNPIRSSFLALLHVLAVSALAGMLFLFCPLWLGRCDRSTTSQS